MRDACKCPAANNTVGTWIIPCRNNFVNRKYATKCQNYFLAGWRVSACWSAEKIFFPGPIYISCSSENWLSVSPLARQHDNENLSVVWFLPVDLWVARVFCCRLYAYWTRIVLSTMLSNAHDVRTELYRKLSFRAIVKWTYTFNYNTYIITVICKRGDDGHFICRAYGSVMKLTIFVGNPIPTCSTITLCTIFIDLLIGYYNYGLLQWHIVFI